MGPSSVKMGKMTSDLIEDKEPRVGEGRKKFGKYPGILYIVSNFLSKEVEMTYGLRLALKIHSLFTVHV